MGELSSLGTIDVVVSVLIGLRGCSRDEAIHEIVKAVAETGVGLGSNPRALMAIASGANEISVHRTEALRRCGHLLAGRIPLVNAAGDDCRAESP
jgi:hypothetical protein